MSGLPEPEQRLDKLAELDAEALRARCAELEAELFWQRMIIRGTNAGTWVWNVQTGETRFNERWAEIVGYTLDELAPISIDTWLNLAHPEDLENSEAALKAHFRGETDIYACDARMHHKNGNWIWVRDYGRVASRTADGEPEWVCGTHIEITERKTLEAKLREALAEGKQLNDTLKRAQRVGRLGYWRASLSTGELFWSEIIYEIFGVRQGEFTPNLEAFMNAVHPEDRALVTESEERARRTGVHDVQHRIIRPDGAVRWVHELADYRPEDNDAMLIGTVQDITDYKELELRLRRLSHTDELTGLWNRRHFMARLEEAFSEFRRHRAPTALIMFDFDRFKAINDNHGHAAGDEVLRSAGRVLTERLRGMDLPARLGGEEFAILLPQSSIEGAEAVARSLCEAIATRPFQLPDGSSLVVTITCGVDGFRPGDTTAEAALHRADRALYRGKAAGRNRVCTADEEQEDPVPAGTSGGTDS